MASKKTPQKPAMKSQSPGREATKAGPGLPSSSPLPGNAGAGLPSGGAAPAPQDRMGSRPNVGTAHERVGMTGEHPMAVPGMPNSQGGNRNPNRVSSTGTRPANTTPEPHNRDNNPEPTNPRMSNGPGTQDAASGRPPQSGPLAVPDMAHPEGRLPNNPRGETTVPTERAPRPRMY